MYTKHIANINALHVVSAYGVSPYACLYQALLFTISIAVDFVTESRHTGNGGNLDWMRKRPHVQGPEVNDQELPNNISDKYETPGAFATLDTFNVRFSRDCI